MTNVRNVARILVIDSGRDAMGYYRRLLQAEGYKVNTTTFLETNRETVERWHPDLIVFDLLVDAEQEQQAWRLIQQLKASVCPPLLLCTAAFVLADFQAYLRKQQVVVLFKPLDTRTLSQQIHTLLASARSNK